jgi:hypothetical protein
VSPAVGFGGVAAGRIDGLDVGLSGLAVVFEHDALFRFYFVFYFVDHGLHVNFALRGSLFGVAFGFVGGFAASTGVFVFSLFLDGLASLAFLLLGMDLGGSFLFAAVLLDGLLPSLMELHDVLSRDTLAAVGR